MLMIEGAAQYIVTACGKPVTKQRNCGSSLHLHLQFLNLRTTKGNCFLQGGLSKTRASLGAPFATVAHQLIRLSRGRARWGRPCHVNSITRLSNGSHRTLGDTIVKREPFPFIVATDTVEKSQRAALDADFRRFEEWATFPTSPAISPHRPCGS